MPQELVQCEIYELEHAPSCVALLTLNRPEQYNAINHELLNQLQWNLDSLANLDHLRMINITGAGEAFCAGGDLKAFNKMQETPRSFAMFLEDLHAVYDSFAKLPVPVVALVNGVALGGGLELALACDFTIASENARIGDAHIRYGNMGGGGVLSRLPQQIGRQKARELVLTGRVLDAKEALSWGIVNQVVPHELLLPTALEVGAKIAATSSSAIANAKKVLHLAEQEISGLPALLANERTATIEYFKNSSDLREGLDAFSSKRQPRFG